MIRARILKGNLETIKDAHIEFLKKTIPTRSFLHNSALSVPHPRFNLAVVAVENKFYFVVLTNIPASSL